MGPETSHIARPRSAPTVPGSDHQPKGNPMTVSLANVTNPTFDADIYDPAVTVICWREVPGAATGVIHERPDCHELAAPVEARESLASIDQRDLCPCCVDDKTFAVVEDALMAH